ncbi:hypothetical protein M2310_002916 [Rhizobium leguminosarum]|uniref:Uncharacterized protein n=1 Tax=Rhizobium esperanzae TaxID=1967781 RepID=A0A7W6ULC9_9HYPH|nr:hypothetical protein [Rhizobium esperanzae]MDH6202235.1 hypothetical protein [Rhizobium leguminosarum]
MWTLNQNDEIFMPGADPRHGGCDKTVAQALLV